MKRKKNYNDDKVWELIKKDIKATFLKGWKDSYHLKIDINSVGPDSEDLSIEERRRLLWEFLKENYHDDGVEVTCPNVDKTYLTEYNGSPFLGIAHMIYSYGETRIVVFFWISPKLSQIEISYADTDDDFEDIRKLLDDSLNKAMAKHSLSVSLSNELSREDIDGVLDFITGALIENPFQ